MLAAYFDESESHNPQDVSVLAGWVSTVDGWQRFTPAWNAKLAEYGLTSYHACEFEWGHGPYAHLDPEARLTLRLSLCKIIIEHALIGIAEGVPREFYMREIAAQLDPKAKMYGDPYMFCFFSCLAHIRMAKKYGRLPDDLVRCFFEWRNKKADRRIVHQYKRLTRDFFSEGFGQSATLGSSEDPALVALQAADLFAYELMKQIRALLRDPAAPRREALALLLQNEKCHGATFVDADRLRQFVQQTRLHQTLVDRGVIK